MSPRARNSDDDEPADADLARMAREAKQPKTDPSTWFWPSSFVATVIAGTFGIGVGFSNFNARDALQQREIDQLKRRTVYTHEWRAWAEVVRLKNPTVDIPDPKDYTSDRSE